MRCKVGDFVVIVRGSSAGHFATVTGPAQLPGRDWSIRPASGKLWGADEKGRRFMTDNLAAMDEQLRPIRDPGDDARDETLEWLPVPSKEVA